MTVLSPLPFQKFFDNDGAPLAGGLLFTYAAGTTNKVVTWKDSAGSEENTNPIELNFRGECDLWITQGTAYKYVLSPPDDTDPPTNPIKTIDNILFPASGGGGDSAPYVVRVDWDGGSLTVGAYSSNASAFTCTRLAQGQYQINFNATISEYGVVAMAKNFNTNVKSAIAGDVQSTHVTVSISDTSDTTVDVESVCVIVTPLTAA